jgi:hypothetical protein
MHKAGSPNPRVSKLFTSQFHTDNPTARYFPSYQWGRIKGKSSFLQTFIRLLANQLS